MPCIGIRFTTEVTEHTETLCALCVLCGESEVHELEMIDILLEKFAGNPPKALRRVGDQEDMLCRTVGWFHHLPNAFGSRLSAIDNVDIADNMLDRGAQDRIMSASENESVDMSVEERLEIDLRHLACDVRVRPSFLRERYK